jgi:hypothetical protein
MDVGQLAQVDVAGTGPYVAIYPPATYEFLNTTALKT